MTQRTGLVTNAALATLLVVPAVAWQGTAPGNLEEALARTLQSIESLAGLERRLVEGDRGAVVEVLRATEAALPRGARPDSRLGELRGEVGSLEVELDALHDAEPGALPGHTGARPAGMSAATTGLDESTRALLGAITPDVEADAPGEEPGDAGAAAAATPPDKVRFEAEGYAADPLRLARALYRKGSWQEALALLDGRSIDPAETYWRARCLEKVGRLDEAIAAFEALVADPAGGWEAERAREDLEFLLWRRDFEERRARLAGKNGR